MKIVAIALSVVAAALACGCAPAGAPSKPRIDTAKIFDAIRTDEVRWNRDWKTGDANLIVAHYAPTAIWMVPGAAPMVGAGAIRAGVAHLLEDKAFSLSFASDKVDVAASGDLAAARGAYALTTTNPKTHAVVTEKGSYVTVYKPQPGGAWKAAWDINAPGAPAATP